MSCDDVQVALSCGEALSADQAAHVSSCEACQTHQREARVVLAAAALPAPTAGELVLLDKTAERVLSARKPRLVSRSWAQVRGYLAAAAVGALVASGALLSRSTKVEQPVVTPPAPAPVVQVRAATPAFEEIAFGDDEPNLSDDEVSFEVGWPSLE